MLTRTRRIAAALTGALALGIGSATWAVSASASAAPAVIPRCAPGSLTVWVDADSADGAAGTIYYDLGFSNISRRTCSLDGYPGLSATSSAGRQLGAAARRIATTPARKVTLPPGASAHSVFGYVDAAVANCHPTATAFYLKVFPPGDTGARRAFFAQPVCTGTTVDLIIERVAPGAAPGN